MAAHPAEVGSVRRSLAGRRAGRLGRLRSHALVAAHGALLLFLVEPMVAKALLPWFGGAPGVWTTCLVFFQALLLAGYGYAHLGRRLGPRRQAHLHVGLLALSLLTLPVLPSAAWRPDGGEAPTLRILAALTVGVGAPFLLLASTAPLVQHWYARAAGRGSPYRLYAWSNAGSLAALLGYPLVVERYLSLTRQAQAWSLAYLAFAVGAGWLALRARAVPAVDEADDAPAVTRPDGADEAPGPPAPTAVDRALWFALSACGAGLLVAITNQLTLDIAVVPLFFLAPLALYLVSFIVAFGGGYRPLPWRVAYPVTVLALIGLVELGMLAPLSWQVGIALATLFVGCMVCHGELARLAPGPRHLTGYYLVMSAGGAAGGLAVAVVAPRIFTELWELPIFVLAPFALRLVLFLRDPAWRERPRIRAAAVVATVIAVVVGAIGFVLPARGRPGVEVFAARGFYGTLRVVDVGRGAPGAVRRLKHGRIEHGTQALDEPQRRVATTYYAAHSGVDLAIGHHPRRRAGLPLRIGVIGLGAGTLAALGGPGDHLRFFELDPEVARVARRYFTYLADSPASVDVVVGDGRLSLEREARRADEPRYDVLVVDAFLGDAIPVHLLTRECGAIYDDRLAADGVLAIHVSNRHLDLVPVVRALAAWSGRVAIRVERHPRGRAFASTWMLVTSNPAYLALSSGPQVTVDLPLVPPVAWTDGHSSLVGILR